MFLSRDVEIPLLVHEEEDEDELLVDLEVLRVPLLLLLELDDLLVILDVAAVGNSFEMFLDVDLLSKSEELDRLDSSSDSDDDKCCAGLFGLPCLVRGDHDLIVTRHVTSA